MATAKSAIRNGLWNAASNTALAISGIVGSVLIVRSLNAQSGEAYGIFSYYAWLAGLLSVLGVLAFPSALTKLASELRGKGAAHEAAALARWTAILLVGLNALMGIGLIVWALQSPAPQRLYLLAIALIPIFNALGRIVNSALWGYEDYRSVSIATATAALLQLALIVAAYLYSWGVVGYLLAVFSINLTTPLFLTVMHLRAKERPRLGSRARPMTSTVRTYLAFVAPSTLILLFDAVVWQRSEVFFLERLSTLEQVGFYNLAYTVAGMFLMLGWALINGYYPSISHDYGAGNWPRIRENVAQALRLTAVFAIPLTLGGWATLEQLIVLLYGGEMRGAVPVSYVLFAGLLPGVLSGLFGLIVSALNRIWLMAGIGMAMAVFNIGLDLLLIPSWQALGAATANTLAQLLHVVVLLWLVRGFTGVRVPWRALGGLLVVGALTTLLLPLLLAPWLTGILGLAARIGLSGLCYLVVVWSLGYLEPLGLPLPAFWPRKHRPAVALLEEGE